MIGCRVMTLELLESTDLDYIDNGILSLFIQEGLLTVKAIHVHDVLVHGLVISLQRNK